jgi:hypothetical protein
MAAPPWSLDDGKLNDWNGGRVYFKDSNGIFSSC